MMSTTMVGVIACTVMFAVEQRMLFFRWIQMTMLNLIADQVKDLLTFEFNNMT